MCAFIFAGGVPILRLFPKYSNTPSKGSGNPTGACCLSLELLHTHETWKVSKGDVPYYPQKQRAPYPSGQEALTNRVEECFGYPFFFVLHRCQPMSPTKPVPINSKAEGVGTGAAKSAPFI